MLGAFASTSALMSITAGVTPSPPATRRMHRREVALEPARVEVVVKVHHEQRRVDVADHRVAAAVGVAPADAVDGRHASMNPNLAVRVGRGQHSVADGEHRARFCERVGRARQHAR